MARFYFVIALVAIVSVIHVVRLAGRFSSYTLHCIAAAWAIDHLRTGDTRSLKRRHDHHDKAVKNAHSPELISLFISRLDTAQITTQITMLDTIGIAPT